MIELLLQAERALSIGLLDRAETLYRQVANADPRNSIAVVGLSRVALDRGNEVEALELARRALVIDPENVAAQRMVARLEEVLEYRGETVEPVAAEAVATEAEPEYAASAEPEPAAPEPEVRPAAPEPVPPEPVPPEPVPPEPVPAARGPVAPTSTVANATAPVPTPAPARRRSWLARLFRRSN